MRVQLAQQAQAIADTLSAARQVYVEHFGVHVLDAVVPRDPEVQHHHFDVGEVLAPAADLRRSPTMWRALSASSGP